ncbi:MAG: hypothetical protein SNJ50_21200, partial [Cyanobacteriota bacterium]
KERREKNEERRTKREERREKNEERRTKREERREKNEERRTKRFRFLFFVFYFFRLSSCHPVLLSLDPNCSLLTLATLA